jgi:hypothetical protein
MRCKQAATNSNYLKKFKKSIENFSVLFLVTKTVWPFCRPAVCLKSTSLVELVLSLAKHGGILPPHYVPRTGAGVVEYRKSYNKMLIMRFYP